jgi:hypothetical protein
MSSVALLLLLIATPLALTRYVGQRCRNEPIQAIDLGVTFVWVVFLYSFLPLAGIWLADLGIGSLRDQRLGNEVPDLRLVTAVGTCYAAFMVAFAVTYALRWCGGLRGVNAAQVPSPGEVIATIALLVAVKLGMLAVQLHLDVEGTDYIGSYAALRGQSVLVQQLVGLLTAIEFTVTVLSIVAFVARAPKFHGVVALLIVAHIAWSIAGGGSRTLAFLSAFAFIVSRSIYDPRLRPATVAAYALFGVAAFLVAGLVRAGFDESETSLSLQLLQSGEFLSVFYNALDLLDRLGDAELSVLNVGLYAVDVLRLVPQQLIGELKIDPAVFYVSTFYPEFSEAGGGLAFGAIAESTIGFGWPEAAVRGGLLGWLYAAVSNRCFSGRLTVLRIFVYVWFVAMSYHAVRDTTFSILPRFVMQVLPLLVLLRLTGILQCVRRVRVALGAVALAAER